MISRLFTRSRSALHRPVQGAVIVSAALIALATLCAPVFAFAATGDISAPDAGSEPIRTEIVIPTSGVEQAVGQAAGTVRDLGQYIGNIYNFLISIVGLVAAVMMIIGGFQYLTAGGDKGRVDAGKKRITNALIGLVLAFSSYAILNTINPALLTLKLPGLSNVKTELAFLPWCEDVEASGSAVTPVILPLTGQQYCGAVGEYTKGGSTLHCVYRGDLIGCDVQTENSPIDGLPDMKVPANCAPDPSFTEEAAAAMVADFRKLSIEDYRKKYEIYIGTNQDILCPTCAGNIPGGLCATCASAAYYNFTKQGKPVPSGYCATYQAIANKGALDSGTFSRVSATGQKYVQYCAYDSDVKTCVGAAIFCEDPIPATGGCYGEPGTVTDAVLGSDSNHAGYNFAPNLYFMITKGPAGGKTSADTSAQGSVVGGWTHGGDRMGTVGSHPGHLSSVCSANPCGYNLARGGCTGTSGFVAGIRAIASMARDGISGIDYCTNVGD